MVLMYLHGFRSTPMSKKGQIMREAFSGRVQYLAPDLNTSPSHVQTIIQEAIKGIAPEELCLVGSSLGGFYATWLAEKVGCRAILLNRRPCLGVLLMIIWVCSPSVTQIALLKLNPNLPMSSDR